MKVSISVDGLDSIVEYMDGLAERVGAALPKAVMQAAQVVQAAAIKKAPNDTGELQAGIIVRGPFMKGDDVSAEVASTAPHAEFIEHGTGPVGAENPSPKSAPSVNASYYSRGEYVFTRVRKDGRSIRYVTDGWVYPVKGGGFRFTRGQKPRPYMYPAFKENEEKAKQIISATISKAVGG